MKDVQICLAAESLKRRVVNSFNSKYNNIPSQQQFVGTIILNPTGYIPRRFTTVGCINMVHRESSISPSKFDKVDQHLPIVQNTRKSTVHFANFNSMNLVNNLYNNSPLPQGRKMSKVMTNKFDLVDPNIIRNFIDNINADEPRQKAYTMGKDKRVSQFVHPNPRMKGNLKKTNTYVDTRRETKHYFNVPLNKEYMMGLDKDTISKVENSMLCL